MQTTGLIPDFRITPIRCVIFTVPFLEKGQGFPSYIHQEGAVLQRRLGPPPCIFRALIVVVNMETLGVRPLNRHLHIPELLKSDVRGKTALRDMVVEHLQTNPVADDGGLAHSDVGKGPGMNQDRAGIPSWTSE